MSGRETIWLARTGALTAVAAWRATPAERARALSLHEAHPILMSLSGAPARSSLIGLYELATGVDAHNVRGTATAVMLARIRAALARGSLLLVGASGGAGGGPSDSSPVPSQADAADDKLVEVLMAKRPAIAAGGGRYRVMTAARWLARPADAPRPNAGSEPVAVAGAEARAVLRRIIASPQTPAAERERWKAVLDRLWDDSDGHGIVLVRMVPVGGSSAPEPDGPTVTPSQLRATIAELTWIEIEIVYEDGTPFDGDCTIAIPGGRTVTGPLGDGGVARFDGIDPGSCKVSSQRPAATAAAAA